MQTTDNHCLQWGILYLAWAKAAPDVKAAKRAAYEQHLKDCPKCREWIGALFQQSQTAVHPEIEP